MADGSRYRADIDGLRAFAVLAVLGFHAEVGKLHGGFIGVDVFFVISGYLISGIIFRSQARGTFSYREFYVRRINRIFPALCVVLLATCAAAWTILFPGEFATLGKHVMAGAGFVSNFVFWSETSYFDSATKPLLHLWSLGVEEQFYIVWPLLLGIVAIRARAVRGFLVAVISLSLAINLWLVLHSNGEAAFYSPWARFWEIIAGALLCHMEFTGSPALARFSQSSRARNAASVVGVILLLLSLLLVGENTRWPGWMALLPVTGTVLLIGSGDSAWINKRVLSLRPLVFVGLVSYPLYLWHWPILVFARMVNEEQVSRIGRVALLVISFALAVGTYYVVEKPIRFGARKRRSAAILLGVMAAIGAGGALMFTRKVKPRLNSSYVNLVDAARADLPSRGSYFNSTGHDITTRSVPGDTAKTVALWGDSHATQYVPRYQELAEQNPSGPQVLLLTYGGCPPLPHVNRVGLSWDGAPWRCDTFFAKALERVMQPSVKTVVISAYWEDVLLEYSGVHSTLDFSGKSLAKNPAARANVLEDFEKMVTALERSGKKVYIVLSTPVSDSYSPMMMLPPRFPGIQNKRIRLSIPRTELLSMIQISNALLEGIAARSGATIINPVDYFCNAVDCPTVDENGAPIYRDHDHIRASYIRTHATFMDVTVGR